MEWMNYHHLLYFWSVVREGSISRAATHLRLAQPTVSAQVRQFERTLGETLLERRGRQVVVTEVGRVVYRYADEIFGLGRELQETLKGLPTGRAPKLRVGVADAVPKLIVYRLLRPVTETDTPMHVTCHEGHPEVEGTMGQATEGIYLVEDEADVARLATSGRVRDPSRLAFVTQTTLSVDDTARVVDALKSAFPSIRPPRKDDICYATTNRQNAVKQIAPNVDVFIVVGSKASSNANRLREVAERLGAQAYLIDDERGLERTWFSSDARVGVSAGASTPEHLITAVVSRLAEWGFQGVVTGPGDAESISFRLPHGLDARK